MSTQPNATDRKDSTIGEQRPATAGEKYLTTRPTVIESASLADAVHQTDAAVQRIIEACRKSIRETENIIHNMEAVLKRLGTR